MLLSVSSITSQLPTPTETLTSPFSATRFRYWPFKKKIISQKSIKTCHYMYFMYTLGVAPITHVRNEISNIQGRSSNVVKVIFHTIRNCS